MAGMDTTRRTIARTPTSDMGHSRPSEASSEFGHVRYAAESGRKFREY